MDNEQAYLAKINVLCRLPYAEREQKHRGLFALADELEALPPNAKSKPCTMPQKKNWLRR